MAEVHFHALPVYRLSPDKYEAWRLATVDEFSPVSGLPADVQESRRRWAEEHVYTTNGPWIFNEITGYLRLYFLGSQVRGEYFDSVQKRAVMTRTKVFTWRTWKLAAERELWQPQTNESILAAIIEYVDDCRRELPNRYFDDSWLRNVGPYVDWLGLLRARQSTQI